MSRKLLVVVVGPTGVGKTAVAVQLARKFQTEVISADSRQMYRELPIGTAAPSLEEMQGVPHHFIGNLSVTQRADAGQWASEARELVDELFTRHNVVICAGGSGLYIDALLNGMDELPARDEKLREQLQVLFEREGIAALQEKLRMLDPEYFAEVDIHNHKRLIRAIEVCVVSGKKYSEQRSGNVQSLPFEVVKVGLELPREELYGRINLRVDKMMEAGLEAEAKAAHRYKDHNALRTVGYKELFDYFEGKTTRDRAVELIKQHSRNYAKRQMTWWRRDSSIRWFNPAQVNEIVEYIQANVQMS